VFVALTIADRSLARVGAAPSTAKD
jgi:hypothetical protein